MQLWTIAAGVLSPVGTLDDERLAATFARGQYEVVFEVGAFYASAGVPLPAVPFLDIVTYRFGIADSAQHYHLPFKCTPMGLLLLPRRGVRRLASPVIGRPAN